MKGSEKSFSHVRLFTTSWTAALQTPLSMEFSRQEHWSGLPFPSLISNGKFQQCMNYNLNICDTLGRISNTYYCVIKGMSP